MKRKLLSTLAMLSIPITMASMCQERPTHRVYEPTPKGYEHGHKTEEQKLRHKEHQKKIKARRNARRRKARR